MCYCYFETLAADGKRKRIKNMSVIPLVSELLLSITHCISTNVYAVLKWQQLARKWTDVTLKTFFSFANYNYFMKSNTLVKRHIISISLFTLFFFPKIY